MDIKPLKNERDYNHALRQLEELWGASVGRKESDELDVLTTLIEAYERQHYPIDRPSPIDVIKFRLEQNGKDYRSLIGVIGQRTRVYEVGRSPAVTKYDSEALQPPKHSCGSAYSAEPKTNC